MLRSDEIAIYVHDGRIIRLYVDANKRKEITDAFANRMGTTYGTGSVRFTEGDREYVVNVAHVAFIESAK